MSTKSNSTRVQVLRHAMFKSRSMLKIDTSYGYGKDENECRTFLNIAPGENRKYDWQEGRISFMLSVAELAQIKRLFSGKISDNKVFFTHKGQDNNGPSKTLSITKSDDGTKYWVNLQITGGPKVSSFLSVDLGEPEIMKEYVTEAIKASLKAKF